MLLSICIPCCKRIEQLELTLTSIFQDNSDVPITDYEVILSDNDPLHEIELLVNKFDFENLKYFHTDCEGFLNSYCVLTYAKGTFLKLHNSQAKFKKGSLTKIIDDIRGSQDDKALLFYSNGMLNKNRVLAYDDFNSFMYNLSYWSSSSNGFCIWKDEFDKIGEIKLNPLFPHTSLFLTQHCLGKYIINDEYLFDVQRIPKRGGHNKFKAFTIEYPSLIDAVYKSGYISMKCKKHILNDILFYFLPTLLFNKYVARIECFDIYGYKQNIKKYFPWFSYYLTYMLILIVPFNKLYNRIKKRLIKLSFLVYSG